MKPTFLLAPAALAAMAAPTADAAIQKTRPHTLATTTDAQVDYFLKIDGIDGESTDAKHKNEIEIASFSWGEVNAGGHATGGGGGAGKVSFQDIHFTTPVSIASPRLFLSCASGEHIKKAVLSVRKAGAGDRQGQVEFLKIEFDDVLVSSYQSGGATDNLPSDQVSLNFAKIEYMYAQQQPDGGLGAVIKTGWDLRLGKAP